MIGSMDLVASCKEKLAYFRIKELKDVLTQLGLAKQGKKQDLVDRIMALLSDEQAGSKSHGWVKRNSLGKEAIAKAIDDAYRKMQVHGATDLASKSLSGSDFNNHSHNHNHNHVKPKEEIDDSAGPLTKPKVRCLCSNSFVTESIIKCEEQRCQVWQHQSCVIIPEKPMEVGSSELPSTFYCEQCRLSRADPFWVTISHPLPAIKFTSSGTAADGSNLMQSVEKTFQLSRADREYLQRNEFDLQVWCMLLNDKVQFRMQWPQYPELQINGIQVRVIPRPGQQLLGANGRDDGPVITTLSREGINKICLGRCDARTFCFGIRIAKKRTLQQVLDLIPKEANGERFEDALARVRRCIGGGNASENADSDSDLEVVAESVTVNLRCPMSGSRIRIAGRFKPCVHMGCFDLHTFVELNQRSRKWQCPICLKNYSLEKIIIDPYFNCITSLLRNCSEDICEVDVKPDGLWRVKGDTESRDLARWHLPDGSLAKEEQPDIKKTEPDPTTTNHLSSKPDTTSDGYAGLRLGIKRNRNGTWEVRKTEEILNNNSNKRPTVSQIPAKPETGLPNMLHMSSGSSGSYRDGDDPSVNQDGGPHFDLSLNNVHEFDSLTLNFDPAAYGNPVATEDNRVSQQPGDTDVIVLTDSDEENPVYEPGPPANGGFPFSTNPEFTGRYQEDPALGTSSAPTILGLFNNSADEFEMNTWSMQGGLVPGPAFRFFGTDIDGTETLGLAPANGYRDNLGVFQDFSNNNDNNNNNIINNNMGINSDMHASLVDNPLAFGGEDPTLQIFLPARPSGSHMQSEMSEQGDAPNGVHPEDWFSLTLAAGGAHDELAPPPLQPLCPEQRQRQQSTGKSAARMEPLDNAASLLLSMNDGSNRQNSLSNNNNNNNSNINNDALGSDYLFSHPRQPRSARVRHYFSIDSDSE